MKTRQAHRGSCTTPPIEHTEPPLTSPSPPLASEQESNTQKSKAVLKDIAQEIKNRKIGRGFTNTPWLCFDLPLDAYKTWKRRYQNSGFVEDKLRYILRLTVPTTIY
jgi:hypothetical protein